MELVILLERKNSSFFKFLTDFLKLKYVVVKQNFILGLLFKELEKFSYEKVGYEELVVNLYF